MPVMDGYEATRQLRQQGHSMPIVAMTANAMQGDEEKCKEAGCSHFLMKPIDIDQLFELLGSILGTVEEDQPQVDPIPSASRPSPQVEARNSNQDQPDKQRATYSTLQDPELQPIVEKFVGTLFCRLQEMLNDFTQNNFDSLAEHAHWLKSAGHSRLLCIHGTGHSPRARSQVRVDRRDRHDVARTGRIGRVDTVRRTGQRNDGYEAGTSGCFIVVRSSRLLLHCGAAVSAASLQAHSQVSAGGTPAPQFVQRC